MVWNYRPYNCAEIGVMLVAYNMESNVHSEWVVLSYKVAKVGTNPDGITPFELYKYVGRTPTPQKGILQALDEASSILNKPTKWISEPLPVPLELAAFGDGECAWHLVTMYPQGKCWIANYHPNTYYTLQQELEVLGCPLPPNIKEHLDDGLSDLTRTKRLEPVKDFDKIHSVEECRQNAYATLMKHHRI